MDVDPLNPPPRIVDLGNGQVRIATTVRRCNACEREIVDGDDLQIRTSVDPDTGEGYTIAVHVPECPT